MTILAPVMLFTLLMMPDGATVQRLYQMTSIEGCLAQAAAFINQHPADFGAISIAAGCVVSPGLRRS